MEQGTSGHEPWHGKTTGYNVYRCRCKRCRAAIAAYRARRRAAGKDRPPKRKAA